jgi:hypothetical protein
MSNPSDPSHPLLVASHAIKAALDEVADVDPLYLTTGDKARLLAELTTAAARITALRAEVLAVADDVAAQTADRSAGTWLAVETRTEPRETIADQRLGQRLRERWPGVRDAVRAGQLTWQQARIITHALDQLPTDLDSGLEPELVVKAEAHLVAEAGHHGPVALRRLGRKVLEVIAPDVADEREHRLLLAEEARVRATTKLSWRPRGDGSTDLHARLPDPVANRLRTYLDAYTSPRRVALDSEVDHLPISRRRGEAFCALLEHLPANGLPRQGQSATQVLVMIDHDTLKSDLAGVAQTSTGETITAGQARRLACTAGIIPIVLGGTSEILDLGRTRRLFTGPVRVALDARDRHCRTGGCDIPAAWCEAHHVKQPWARGGRTDLADGILLCPFHHHRAHDPTYHRTTLPNGNISFHRRT